MPPIINLGSSVIQRTYLYKYLGVTISSNLSWSEHIHIICIKARKTIGLLYRHFYLNSNTPSLQQLYLTLVQPVIEYACQVWHPHLAKDIVKLECVQKLALRLCTKQWTLDYSTLLSLCDLPSLETHRKYFCLLTTYKIVNKLIDFSPDILYKESLHFTQHQTSYFSSLSLTQMYLCTHTIYDSHISWMLAIKLFES